MPDDNLSVHSSDIDARYNDEVCLLDSLYAFHPDIFEQLTPEEFALLRQYYLVGEEVPESIFSYREQITSEDPEIAAKASRAFKTVCMLFRIEGG
jgi:hypothetical protein